MSLLTETFDTQKTDLKSSLIDGELEALRLTLLLLILPKSTEEIEEYIQKLEQTEELLREKRDSLEVHSIDELRKVTATLLSLRETRERLINVVSKKEIESD